MPEKTVKGEVVYLYAFDVAYEIITAKVREILAEKPFPFEVRLEHTFPKDIPLYRPLAIEPPPLPGCMRDQPVRLLIRVYDIGVVTVAMRVAFDVPALPDLLPYHKATLDTGQTLDAIARDLCASVCRSLRDVMVRPSEPYDPEAYTAFCITEIPDVADANVWLAGHRRAVAGVLSETDPERLSEQQVREALRIQRSFEHTDLVVIDWDACVVVDLSDYVEDVLFVLELANIQVEEFRVMDRRLDQYFNQTYDDLERERLPLFGGSALVLRALRRFRVDVSKLADEVTHITKFFGDWYLARVYLGARDRFHLDHWRSSVVERLGQLDQLYSVVHGEIYDRRMLWLEIVIVVLFVIDVLGLFFLRR
jgi:hypothetical protein